MFEEKADLTRLFTDNSQSLPFHRLLGLDSKCFDFNKRCICFEMRNELVGNTNYGILHGGVIASMMDIEGGFLLALDGAWPKGENDKHGSFKGGTIDLRIDYLRPGKGKYFVVSGNILRWGSKVAVVHTELHDDNNELVATGTGTYLVG
jgi:uncharacterized protein (TIGR00369 family)